MYAHKYVYFMKECALYDFPFNLARLYAHMRTYIYQYIYVCIYLPFHIFANIHLNTHMSAITCGIQQIYIHICNMYVYICTELIYMFYAVIIATLTVHHVVDSDFNYSWHSRCILSSLNLSTTIQQQQPQ